MTARPHELATCDCAACREWWREAERRLSAALEEALSERCTCDRSPNGTRRRHPYCKRHGSTKGIA